MQHLPSIFIPLLRWHLANWNLRKIGENAVRMEIGESLQPQEMFPFQQRQMIWWLGLTSNKKQSKKRMINMQLPIIWIKFRQTKK